MCENHGKVHVAGVLVIVAMLLVGCAEGLRVGGPSIEGTYKLMSRELPDGTRLTPPDVSGLMTYTDRYRQLNVVWTDETGKSASVSLISEYELVGRRYWEQSLCYIAGNEIDGSGLAYDLSRPGGASDVYITDDGVISFELPLFGEPAVVFTRSGFTATREGEFVDHWVRID